jgi:hypothetical protein
VPTVKLSIAFDARSARAARCRSEGADFVFTVRPSSTKRRMASERVVSYRFSWDDPIFDSPFEQRRLRFLNTLFLAMARCGGKAEVRGREAREIRITIHQTSLSVSLDQPTKERVRPPTTAPTTLTSYVLSFCPVMTVNRSGHPGRMGKAAALNGASKRSP